MRGQFCAIMFFVLFCATSCTTAKLEELRQIAPKGTPLQIALAREYLAFSDSEAKQYDWIDSYHFADKGLRSAYGQDVAPEEPDNWDVGEENLPEFRSSRAELMAVLQNAEKVGNKPDVAARAQYFYDCWLEQQEEGWQTQDILLCKEGFHNAMAELNAQEDTGTPVPRTTAYMVFFNHNEWVLTPEGARVLDKVIEDLLQLPDAQVLLHGHTDTSGTDDYNMSLSERRAKAVRQALVEGGVDEKHISYFAFGETDLRVQTADGIREPANRRVEIFLE